MQALMGFRTLLVLVLVSLAGFAKAQLLKGKIVDAGSREAIPFAVVIVDNTNTGTTADLDGNFQLNLPAGATNITIQLVGYSKQTIALSDLDLSKTNIIHLKSSGISLAEIVVRPAENPAIPIIRQVIRKKPLYDISNLPHYSCNTYAKTYFTFSNREGDESIWEKFRPEDSIPDILKKSYLFFMESVTQKNYRYKNITQEKVLASRVSGFKSAPFGAFASQLQSFTFYDNNIELLGVRYVNPLSKGTFKRYNFEITDTVLNGSDTTILIRFSPKKNNSFKGLKGLLYINKNQYVLTNVLAEPAEPATDGNGVKIQQLYHKIDSLHWFPKQANTEIMFYGIKTLVESENMVPAYMKGVSRLYIKDVNLDTNVRIRNRSVEAYNEAGFDSKDEAYWNKERIDTLNQKEQKTYRIIDSLGKKVHLDDKLKWLNALSTGQFQVGYVNLDLKHILRLNDYEYMRLGLGLSTSNKLSRWASVGGYGGYGFRDKAWKYGGHLQVNFNRQQNAYFLAEGAKEVVESAGTFFLEENTSFLSTQKIRDLLISQMDKVSFGKVSLNAPLLRYVKASAYMQVQQRQSPFGYAMPQNGLLLDEKKSFTFNEAGLQFKIWPKEKFTESMDHLVSMGSRWPVFFVNVAKGFTGNWLGYAGNYEYTKIDLRIDQQINFKVKGFVSYQLQAGKVWGSVPYSIQYNNKSSRTDRYWVSAEKTFETMYLNEFISTQYAALFVAINTGRLLPHNKHLNPELELVHNYGIGTLNNRQNITNIELNDMRKGYSEAGIRIKSLYRSGFSNMGIGVYYRYGSYASDVASKNLVYKLVLSYSF